MQVNGPDAAEQERRRMKRALVRIAAVEVDWRTGVSSATEAMATISEILGTSKVAEASRVRQEIEGERT